MAKEELEECINRLENIALDARARLIACLDEKESRENADKSIENE